MPVACTWWKLSNTEGGRDVTFLDSLSTNLGWVIGSILLFLAILGSLRYAASRYKKVSPSRLGIIYGRKCTYEIPGPDGGQPRQEKLGFRLLNGGGTVVLPFF